MHTIDQTIPFLNIMLWFTACFVLATFVIVFNEGAMRKQPRDERLKIAAVTMLIAMVFSFILAAVSLFDFLFI